MTEVPDSSEMSSTEAMDGISNGENRLKAGDGPLAQAVEQRFPEIGKLMQDALKSIND